MKISAIYIAKNEAENIARSLESVKDSVDELILVDTGSSDDTVKIFESYGGRVYHQPWQDDFSAPRNLALSKATGDWVILLDADEYFAKNCRKNIVDIIKRAPASCNGILITLRNIEKSTGKLQDKFYALRIIRNIPGLEYRGRIHEGLWIDGEELGSFCRVEENLLFIEHTGYSKEMSEEKGRRNLSILQAEIKAGRPIDTLYRYLCDSYYSIGDMKQAIEYAKLEAAKGRQLGSDASRCHKVLIAHYADAKNRIDKLERLKWTEKALADYPELPEFAAEYSECLAQWHRYKEAADNLKKIITDFRNQTGLEISLLNEGHLKQMQDRYNYFKKMAKKVEKIKISACVIVKNEAANLPLWLATTKRFADEIIVVDTGSSDNTVQLAKESGARVIEIEWQEDFASAKNTALEAASGDWIVFNDADETFFNPEAVRGFIAYAEYKNAETYSIMIPMSNVNADDGDKEIERFDAIRIFKRLPGLMYHGKVHEMIGFEDKELDYSRMLRADDVLLVRHTGYSSSIIKSKLKRNLKLIIGDAGEENVHPAHYRHLAECFFGLGKYEKALNYALRATQSEYTSIGQNEEMYSLALFSMEKLDYGIEDKLAVIEAGLRENNQYPDFWGLKGLVMAELQEYEQAVTQLKNGLRLYYERLEDGSRSLSSYFNGILIKVNYTLGICLDKLGNRPEAMEYYREALNLRSWDEDALSAIADSYDGEPVSELTDILDEYFDNTLENMKVLISVWKRNGFIELARYYSQRRDNLYGAKTEDEVSFLENPEKELSEAKQGIALNMQYVFVSILGGKGDFADYAGKSKFQLLPDGLQNIILVYFEEATENISISMSDYMSMLPAVLTFGNDAIIDKYVKIGASFGDDAACEIASKLLKTKMYQKALTIYEGIPADSKAADGSFWNGAGICLYQLGQYEGALECLIKASEHLLLEKEQGENKTYISWCQEAMKK
ncbi:MAG: glycosyltransferase [Selenomonadaceae bacterium]|nr:glycosyltransferase [Selenomonadaceae bacterium]